MNIEDLISQYIDGTLPGDVEAELHHRLAVSPEARRLFRTHIMLRGIARDQRVLHTPAPEMRAKLFDRLVHEEGMAAKAASPVPVVPVSSAGAQPAIPSAAMQQPERRRRRVLPWLIPTLIAGMLVIVLWNGDPVGIPSGSGTDLAYEGTRSTEIHSSTPYESVPLAGADPGAGLNSEPRQSSPHPLEQSNAQADGVPPRAPRQNDLRAGRHPEAERAELAMTSSPSRTVDVDQSAPATQDGEAALLASKMASSPQGMDGTLVGDTTGADAQAASEMVFGALSDAVLTDRELKLNTAHSLGHNGAGKQEPDLRNRKLSRSVSSGSHDTERLSRGFPTLISQEQTQAELLDLGEIAPFASAPRSAMGGGSDSASEYRPMVQAPILESPGPGPVTLTFGLQQHSLVSLSRPDVHLQVLLKAGVELGGGDHQVYGLISGATYRESYSDSLIGVMYDGAVYPPQSVTGASLRSGSAQVHEDSYNEVWLGGGYRYSREIAKGWRIGVGVWTGAGAHYLRLGSELPVAYQPVRWMRVEILPTIQYTKPHTRQSLTTTTDFQPELRYSEKSQRTTLLETGTGLNLGIGIGASVLW